jgi:hypothetical protein
MSSPTAAPVTYYRPAEVAAMLRCSEWWIKEQARRRRIPFSWIGGSYLFTEDHVTEIVRLFEVRPDPAVDGALRREVRRLAAATEGEPVVQLRARTPRRTRNAA